MGHAKTTLNIHSRRFVTFAVKSKSLNILRKMAQILSSILIICPLLITVISSAPAQGKMTFQRPYPIALVQPDGTYCVIVRFDIKPRMEPGDTKFIEFTSKREGGLCPFICKEGCPIKSSTCRDYFNLDLQEGMMFYMKNISRGNEEEWATEWDISIINYLINQSVHTSFKLKPQLLTQADDNNENFPYVNYECA